MSVKKNLILIARLVKRQCLNLVRNDEGID